MSHSLAPAAHRSHPAQLMGGWELGLLTLMALLYGVGVWINPAFFGSTDAFAAVLRDTARFGVMAVAMTFVIVNRDLDLSVGSTLGLVATVFSIIYAQTHLDLSAPVAVCVCLLLGTGIGLINGLLVTILKVPAFIATLTMLFIGRGLVLGLTGGKTIAYGEKAAADPLFFIIGEGNVFGFNNQVFILVIVTIVGAFALAKTTLGYQSYAVGGNELAASYGGISTRSVRIRAYVLSSLAATVAGLMNVAQDKGVNSQYGQGAELIVIAAVIVGGASIAGGRGRVLGAVFGAALVVLIDKVLREGIPVTRFVDVAGIRMEVEAMAQLPPGAVPAFLGLILLGAVLLEPIIVRRRVFDRLWARLRGREPPLAFEAGGGVAIAAASTRGSAREAEATGARGLAAFLHRRDAAAILSVLVLWGFGFALRPDFWASLDNSFNLLLAFTEIALLAVGLTFVLANGDVDLSVGSVLAFSGATAAFLMVEMNAPPWMAVTGAFAVGLVCGVINGVLVVRFGLPAFVATLGMFYIARGLGAWLVAGRQLSGFPEGYTVLGRKVIEVLDHWQLAPPDGVLRAVAEAMSWQTLFMAGVAIAAAVVLGKTVLGQMVYAVGGNARAAQYAGIDVARVRFLSLVFSALCAAAAGVIYVAYLRSFNPAAGQLRELDAISAVIIGGGSIFGGFGTILGSLAGAGVITLLRAILSLQVIFPDGTSFVMPQHWVGVFIGLILLAAVLTDIWLRQENLLADWRDRLMRRVRAKQPRSALGGP